MNRIYVTIMLLGAVSLPSAAQRLDGCPEHERPAAPQGTPIRAVSREDQDLGLQEAGYGRTRDGLAVALRDPRADVRSLASLRLGQVGQKADLAPLMRAWLAEGDVCTKGKMGLALGMLVPQLAFDAKQHLGAQPRVTPFAACTASEPPLMRLTIEQVTGPSATSPTVRISARNQTPQTIAFVRTRSPEELFSVTVLGSTGAPAKVTRGQEWMYEPVRNIAGLIGNEPTFLALPPREDVAVWTWKVGDDFDMSAPGPYYISLGGRIDYLDTTVCSNTLEVRVEK